MCISRLLEALPAFTEKFRKRVEILDAGIIQLTSIIRIWLLEMQAAMRMSVVDKVLWRSEIQLMGSSMQ